MEVGYHLELSDRLSADPWRWTGPDASGARAGSVASAPHSFLSSAMDSSSLTDAQVVHAVLTCRTDAYGVLVRRYQDVLFAHAVRMVGERDEATDLVQRVLVRAFRRLASLREPERVGGWLFRILANECREQLRNRRRRDVSLESLPLLPDPAAAARPALAAEPAEWEFSR